MLEQYYYYFYYYYRDYNNYLHKVLEHKRAKKCVKQACAWEFLRFLFIPEVDRPTDACEEGTHTCDIPERAQCSYRGGSSYVCSCLPGFVGDGRICEGTARGRVNISRSVCVKLAFHRDEVREVTFKHKQYITLRYLWYCMRLWATFQSTLDMTFLLYRLDKTYWFVFPFRHQIYFFCNITYIWN